MRKNETSEQIDHDRRRLLGGATVGIAAAGAISLFPTYLAAAAEDTIRPFSINVPEEQLVDLRRRIAATRWPERETVSDESQGVQLAPLQGNCTALGNGLRLAQSRGEAERFAAVHHRDRWAGHSFRSRSFET
jgi:hypothetical protein